MLVIAALAPAPAVVSSERLGWERHGVDVGKDEPRPAARARWLPPTETQPWFGLHRIHALAFGQAGCTRRRRPSRIARPSKARFALQRRQLPPALSSTSALARPRPRRRPTRVRTAAKLDGAERSAPPYGPQVSPAVRASQQQQLGNFGGITLLGPPSGLVRVESDSLTSPTSKSEYCIL